jgi:hypothetical protein
MHAKIWLEKLKEISHMRASRRCENDVKIDVKKVTCNEWSRRLSLWVLAARCRVEGRQLGSGQAE